MRDASGNAVVAVLLAHPETAWARGSAVTMPGVVRAQNWGTVSLDVDASADITWTVTLRVPGEWMHTEYGVRPGGRSWGITRSSRKPTTSDGGVLCLILLLSPRFLLLRRPSR